LAYILTVVVAMPLNSRLLYYYSPGGGSEYYQLLPPGESEYKNYS